jgi:hypothetical protein
MRLIVADPIQLPIRFLGRKSLVFALRSYNESNDHSCVRLASLIDSPCTLRATAMPKENFRLLIVFIVFLALLVVWACPEGISDSAAWGTDPGSIERYAPTIARRASELMRNLHNLLSSRHHEGRPQEVDNHRRGPRGLLDSCQPLVVSPPTRGLFVPCVPRVVPTS